MLPEWIANFGREVSSESPLRDRINRRITDFWAEINTCRKPDIQDN